ncbi:unnamed protein product [Pleuronectes platessa]|uniref:Uncharacterized protein n=1 Tax=Pleuronectes platessa TaxID=8262 RepID=A0A9N7VJS4_PLEPL|nr:unnamed protein product [Pleuronectes platessa]
MLSPQTPPPARALVTLADDVSPHTLTAAAAGPCYTNTGPARQLKGEATTRLMLVSLLLQEAVWRLRTPLLTGATKRINKRVGARGWGHGACESLDKEGRRGEIMKEGDGQKKTRKRQGVDRETREGHESVPWMCVLPAAVSEEFCGQRTDREAGLLRTTDGNMGEGAGLIRDRPAAALSLAERLADPCCLIGTGSLLTRAHQQGEQPGSTGRCGDRPSTVIRKTPE